jgi:glycine oxidase
MSDCLIIGGGVIGLSLAYELAGLGRKVRLIEAGTPGREASWAGAGILPPASAHSDDPLEQLMALSNGMHVAWHGELASTTGIDNGYRRTGAIYLARDQQLNRQLVQFVQAAQSGGIANEHLNRESLAKLEPALNPRELLSAWLLEHEAQIRNPRHLRALVAGCIGRGVEMTSGVTAQQFEIRRGRVQAVRTNVGSLAADQFCVTAGAWSSELCGRLGAVVRIKPVRGQMLLLSTPMPLLSRIVNEGSRYLVPRNDARVLVGSTEEDVGFDRSTTASAETGLLEFAIGLAPALAQASLERFWAGLRPATEDGRPYLGAVPDVENAFVAAGHFRSGLQLSTGTARVMGQLMRGLTPQIDLAPFSLDRHGGTRHAGTDAPNRVEQARRKSEPIS